MLKSSLLSPAIGEQFPEAFSAAQCLCSNVFEISQAELEFAMKPGVTLLFSLDLHMTGAQIHYSIFRVFGVGDRSQLRISIIDNLQAALRFTQHP